MIKMRTSVPCSNALFLWLMATKKELKTQHNRLSGKTPREHRSEDMAKEEEDLDSFLPPSLGCCCGQQALERSSCMTVSSGVQKTMYS